MNQLMNKADYCLIIDNNSERRNGLKEEVRKTGFANEVTDALNCGHGLLYLNQCYDKIADKDVVVIFNVHTPMMGGFEFLNELNKGQLKRTRNRLKLIVLGDLSEEEEERCKSYGVEHFINCSCSVSGEWKSTLGNVFSGKIVRKRKNKEVNTEMENNQVFMIPNSRVG